MQEENQGASPCLGNCAFSDELYGHDPGYGELYDGSRCSCKRCPNFRLCKCWAPEWVYDCHNGRCGNCNASFRKNLVFVDHEVPATCPICLDSKVFFIEHPAECGHAMCADCFKEQWWPVHEINLNPRDWGFYTDCRCQYCIDDNEYPCKTAMDAWEQNEPGAYAAWQLEEERQQDELDQKLASRADKRACPVCRAHLRDAPSNSW